MLLILARHGNTFGPDDTPVWVGANEDLELVEKGLDQSRDIGRGLASAGIIPDQIVAGPLKRTRVGAELAAETSGYSGTIDIDERLREIDYGVWGGQPDSVIAERWGEAAITAWRDHSIVPAGAGWSPSVETLQANARAVYDLATRDRSDDVAVLIVTSNGILRYFHTLLAGPGADPLQAKVKTGHMGVAKITARGPALKCWNVKPEAIKEALL